MFKIRRNLTSGLSDLQPDGTVGLEEFLPRSIRNIRANKRKERFLDEWKKKRR